MIEIIENLLNFFCTPFGFYFIISVISLIIYGLDRRVFRTRAYRFMNVLARYGIDDRREISVGYFTNEAGNYKYFHAKWGEDDLKEQLEFIKSKTYTHRKDKDELYVKELRRYLNYDTLTYPEFYILSKIFKLEQEKQLSQKENEGKFTIEAEKYLLSRVEMYVRLINEESELFTEYYPIFKPNKDKVDEFLYFLRKKRLITGLDKKSLPLANKNDTGIDCIWFTDKGFAHLNSPKIQNDDFIGIALGAFKALLMI